MDLNFYPRPPRGGRHLLNNCICTIIEISIHALREEGDTTSSRQQEGTGYFYPRPPRGGRRAGKPAAKRTR